MSGPKFLSWDEDSPLRRWTILGLKIVGALALVGFIAMSIMVLVARSELPGFAALKSSPNGQMVRVHAADGSVIVSLGPSYGEWLEYDEIPENMKQAMVAVEDRRFYSHFGIDPPGLVRGIFGAAINGHRIRAVSTITQQLARNIFLSNSRTLGRKFREMVLAVALETKLSKEEVLELYLNRVYFGGGAYGIDAASRRFFGHSARELSLAEAAIIAGLVKAPSRYSPTADAQAAIRRASLVLSLMLDQEMITPEQASSTVPADTRLAPSPPQNSVRYFTDWALPQLDMMIDERVKAIDVWTTLDVGMQRSATASIRAHVPAGAQGALVAMERDGAVRAMVGGTDYVDSNYNRATVSVRQPGSAWKIFVYLAAIEAGYRPEDIVTDEPVEIDGWTPRNSGNRYAGDITVRTAFAYSKNTVAAQIGNEIGFGTVASMARRFGITTPINTHPSMVLGSSEVRVIDMTRAVASIAAGGQSVTPYAISKVTTIDGDVLYEHDPDTPRQLVQPWVATAITDLMHSAVQVGTGRAAQIGRPVAGKTGTTNSNKDGYFLGFSSGLTTGVWMGRDDAKPVGGLQGGRAPAQAFASFMKAAVANRPVENFDLDAELPDWLLEEEDDVWYGEPEDGMFVDENGMPIETRPGDGDGVSDGEDDGDARLDQGWIDEVLGRDPAPPPEQQPQSRRDPASPADGAPTRLLPSNLRPEEEPRQPSGGGGGGGDQFLREEDLAA